MATPNIPDWEANKAYVANDYFVNAGLFYKVTTPYTSGATFGLTEGSNVTTQVSVETWMTFDEWRRLGNQAYQKSFSVEQQLSDIQDFALAVGIALSN